MHNTSKYFSGLFSLEKENMRVDREGNISQVKHRSLYDEDNPYIKKGLLDFKVKMITSSHGTLKEAYNELHNIQHVVLSTIGEEYLWPESTPPKQSTENNIHSDSKRTLISGIQFNLAFSDDYLKELYSANEVESFTDFKNSIYLKIVKYFRKNKCLFTKHSAIQSLYSNEEAASDEEHNNFESVNIKKNEFGNASCIEVRLVDINLDEFNGVTQEYLELIHMFFVHYSMLNDFDVNQHLSSIHSKHSNVTCLEQLLESMRSLAEVPYDFEAIIAQWKYRNTNLSNDCVMDIARNQKKYVLEHPLELIGFESMELSTKILIQSAIKYGKEFTILDRKENFIKLKDLRSGRVEYVKQATKTSLDNYSSVLAMENKAVTKMILADHDVSVPRGFIITEMSEGHSLYNQNKLPSNLVIKPNNTNFGLGITIFTDSYSEEEFDRALSLAFSFDQTVLLEEFVSGKEYRFLIIDGEVIGVLHRRAASVLGDGIKTIKELVSIKNENPLRNKGYKTPLEIIEIDEIVIDFLKRQGLSVDVIPKLGQRIFLRENSNISTGGDSIDYTDEVHQSYFTEALRTAEIMKVNITGVDMLIEDITRPARNDNFSVIELNFNPAIHIHCYPYQGKNRRVGDKVIEALFKK